jgi:starch synthase
MTRKERVLFISQEITPYLPESHIGKIGRQLPQGIQERGREIRTFMPRFGCVNERRNQLHEVIRLSGMNLIIDDNDHPLIIKVASIQSARMQVYFIDNDEYFLRKFTTHDKDNKVFKDNDERLIFFCRGVIETVKKLNWTPDVIHCHGWMTSLIPLLIKKVYHEDPVFENARVVYSVYNDGFKGSLDKKLASKLRMDGMSEEDLAMFAEPTHAGLTGAALRYADAVVKGDENLDPKLAELLTTFDGPLLGSHDQENYVDAYSSFYDEVLATEGLLAE